MMVSICLAQSSTGKEIEDVLEKFKAALLQLQKEIQTSQEDNSESRPSLVLEEEIYGYKGSDLFSFSLIQ